MIIEYADNGNVWIAHGLIKDETTGQSYPVVVESLTRRDAWEGWFKLAANRLREAEK